MPRLPHTLLILALCTALPMPVMAQTGLAGIVKSVNALDKNFDAADKNRNGLLTKEEANAGNVAFIARHFDAIDVHHRGTVSKADVHAYIKRMLMQHPGAAPATSSGKPD